MTFLGRIKPQVIIVDLRPESILRAEREAQRRARKYLGAWRCERCRRVNVRVYDWLPTPVLCARCRRATAREERAQL